MRYFRRRVATKAVAKEFWLYTRLKGEVLAYGLEKGFYLFWFLKSGEWDKHLNRHGW